MPLQTVEPQRLYRQIAEQVRALITGGEFGPGTRLPAERDLARQLGVSRPSVREALIALEVEGWVEVRTGSGVYVLDRSERSRPGRQVPASEWGPLELIRARRAIEGEIASLAAQNAKRKDMQAIRAAIDAMAEDTARGVAPLAGDRAFHLAVAEATGNVVLLETVQTFWDARHGPLFERLGDYFETVPSWRSAIAEHEAVLAAIRTHDAPAARAAMQQHMDKSHARFSASWRRAALPRDASAP
ncbi:MULTISPECIES: FadR/GntR family transcriptional regulator [Ramlibacter]|uniref:FadR family transcriptional regulator n=1 Tax=Ramlibacter aquaticus TaxID=2780094 RepID=A0ABR9SGH0_9BURK|nr:MULTISPECIES: FadR/GntR family transcriptional regulator [Ramlibacter]MBE7941451.1 FadR family transcriptional regulator [Ramlibacter aquaticus]